jgi:hypothetical protein
MARRGEHIEITKNMRSFAFLRAQSSITQLRDLLASVNLYNDFPHTLENGIFFEFAHNKYQAGEERDGEESAVDYIMRLDLGRNTDFLQELAFLHLVNTFITYCADILAVAALGSPEKFDLKVRMDAAELARLPSQPRIMREIAIAVVSQINYMSYSDLRRLLLSKVTLGKSALAHLKIIDQAVQKRNVLTHGLGISKLAVSLHETGGFIKREKVTSKQFVSVWNAIAKISLTIDKLLMKNYNVWRGVDICAPGLYRYKDGRRILQEDF